MPALCGVSSFKDWYLDVSATLSAAGGMAGRPGCFGALSAWAGMPLMPRQSPYHVRCCCYYDYDYDYDYDYYDDYY